MEERLGKRANRKTFEAAVVFLVLMIAAVATGDIIYVDNDAALNGNGQTWGTAYKYLQEALYDPNLAGGWEIWAAEGTYHPDEDEGGNVTLNNRDERFQLKSGVALYGGFAGNETALKERNWRANVTILSGDLWDDDDDGFHFNADNSHHVVIGSGADPNTILDGFTITGSCSNNPYHGEEYRGGGMCNLNGSPTVTNCIFTRNFTSEEGGGMYNWASSPTVTNCMFIGNWAGFFGGGICNEDESSPILTNCIFNSNLADDFGGGVHNLGGSMTITNCTFRANSAGIKGGGIWNDCSSPTVTNCIIWGNNASIGEQIYNGEEDSAIVTYSDVQGGCEGTGNIDADPMFTDPNGPDGIAGTDDDDLRLFYCSPCIDAGDSNSVPTDSPDLDQDGNTSEKTPLDLIGNERFVDVTTYNTGNPAAPGLPVVDMGAYEMNEPFDAIRKGDLNVDCYVDLADMAILALHWLEYLGLEQQ